MINPLKWYSKQTFNTLAKHRITGDDATSSFTIYSVPLYMKNVPCLGKFWAHDESWKI